MNFDTAIDGYKAKYIVTIHRVAAACQLVVEAFEVAPDNEFVLIAFSLCHHFAVHAELFSRAGGGTFGQSLFALAQFDVGVYDAVNVNLVIAKGSEKVKAFLIS